MKMENVERLTYLGGRWVMCALLVVCIMVAEVKNLKGKTLITKDV
jgi:hypothetical protein